MKRIVVVFVVAMVMAMATGLSPAYAKDEFPSIRNPGEIKKLQTALTKIRQVRNDFNRTGNEEGFSRIFVPALADVYINIGDNLFSKKDFVKAKLIGFRLGQHKFKKSLVNGEEEEVKISEVTKYYIVAEVIVLEKKPWQMTAEVMEAYTKKGVLIFNW